MCVAIPARVIESDATHAVVERYGERLAVSLMLMDEAVALGDYLIIQAQHYAVRKIDADEARQAYRLFDEIVDAITEQGVQ